MTRTAFAFQVDDLSALARTLHRQLTDDPGPLSHLGLMNMLTRAAGYRNFQHFRATALAEDRAAPPEPLPDRTRVDRVRRLFDAKGRLTQWPAKTSIQHLAMWALWARLPAGCSMTEREISAELNRWHLFGDPAILRRTLWELKLVTRSLDGRDYRRVGQLPPPDARALIRDLQAAAQEKRTPRPPILFGKNT